MQHIQICYYTIFPIFRAMCGCTIWVCFNKIKWLMKINDELELNHYFWLHASQVYVLTYREPKYVRTYFDFVTFTASRNSSSRGTKSSYTQNNVAKRCGTQWAKSWKIEHSTINIVCASTCGCTITSKAEINFFETSLLRSLWGYSVLKNFKKHWFLDFPKLHFFSDFSPLCGMAVATVFFCCCGVPLLLCYFCCFLYIVWSLQSEYVNFATSL